MLATTGGDPSAVETRPYVSGAAVLGALASRWLARPCADPAIRPEFRRLFLDKSVRWFTAYPEGAGGERLLPIRQSLVQRKGDARAAFDKAHPEFAGRVKSEPDTQWQPPPRRCPSCASRRPNGKKGSNADLEPQPRLTPRLHHTRDDREAGRSTDGAMFSYIALEAGERLVGHVLCETEEDARTLHGLLSAGPLPLGRSRTATIQRLGRSGPAVCDIRRRLARGASDRGVVGRRTGTGLARGHPAVRLSGRQPGRSAQSEGDRTESERHSGSHNPRSPASLARVW